MLDPECENDEKGPGSVPASSDYPFGYCVWEFDGTGFNFISNHCAPGAQCTFPLTVFAGRPDSASPSPIFVGQQVTTACEPILSKPDPQQAP